MWKKGQFDRVMIYLDRLLINLYTYKPIVRSLYPVSPYKWIQENINFFDYKFLSQIIIVTTQFVIEVFNNYFCLQGIPFFGFHI